MPEETSRLHPYLILKYPSLALPGETIATIPDDFLVTVGNYQYVLLYVFPEDYTETTKYSNPQKNAEFNEFGVFPNLDAEIKSHKISMRYSDFNLYKLIEQIVRYATINKLRVIIRDSVKPDKPYPLSTTSFPGDSTLSYYPDLTWDDFQGTLLGDYYDGFVTERRGMITLPFNTKGLVQKYLPEKWEFSFAEMPLRLRSLKFLSANFDSVSSDIVTFIDPKNYKPKSIGTKTAYPPTANGGFLDVKAVQRGFTARVPFCTVSFFNQFRDMMQESLRDGKTVQVEDGLDSYSKGTRNGYITDLKPTSKIVLDPSGQMEGLNYTLAQEIDPLDNTDTSGIGVEYLSKGFTISFTEKEWNYAV